jgi:hypothetical protein
LVRQVVEHSAPTERLDRLTSLSVDTTFAEALRKCKDELEEVFSDQFRPPMTNNHYFTTTLQNQRQRKYQKITQHDQDASRIKSDHDKACHTYYDAAMMDKAMTESIEQNMDKFSAEEALDNQRAYYTVC